MKKSVTIFSSLIFLLLGFQVKAQVNPASYDTLFHAQVGPGMFHTEYEIRNLPWRIQVMEIETNQPGLEFRTVKANNNLVGLRKPSEMRDYLEESTGAYVVGGVNGDFFQTGGVPVSAQVIDGELLKKPHPRELIVFDDSFKPWIAGTSFSGEVSNADISVSVNGINQERGTNHLTVFNSYFGTSTGSNEYGTEYALKLIGDRKVNKAVAYEVTRVEVGVGDMQFGDDDLILSSHGTAAESLTDVKIGDTLNVQLNLNPIDRNIVEAIGGSTQFVKNGIVNSNWEERHPRTAVGFSQDTSKVYFVVVDGRQTSSVGMMLSEMGEFMVNIGVGHAINLDGGGSSALLVQDEVANNPSDGGLQRSVANALFVTLPDLGVGEVDRIQMKPGFNKVFLGQKANFSTLGFDSNHRFSEIPSAEIEYSVDEEIGSISASGSFTASLQASSGYVYAKYGELVDSARIKLIGAGSLELHPNEAAIDTGMIFTPTFKVYDEDGLEQTLGRGDLNWSVTNSEMGEVDEKGNFTATTFGEVGLIATFDTASDTAWIQIENNEGFYELSQFSNIEDWTIGTEDLDISNVSLHQIENGIEVQFSYPSQNVEPHIYLYNNFDISGVPKFADVVTSSDGENYVLTLDIETLEGGRFRMAPPVYANFTEPEPMHFTFEQSQSIRLTSGSKYYFPFSMTSLNIRLPKNQTGEDTEGFFRFHNLGVTYGDTPTSNEKEVDLEVPQQINLRQNYPNPFNPTTQISFNLPAPDRVSLEIFDVLGRKVATLVDGARLNAGSHAYNFDASSLSSGIYLYQLSTESATLSKKMMLIK